MKRKKLLSLLVLCIMLLNVTPVNGKGLALEADQPDLAVVINVIDGNVIEVAHLSSQATIPKRQVIKLTGLDTLGSDDAYKYVKDQLLGRAVFILYDDNISEVDDFRSAYVFVNMDESFNELMLRLGLAYLDEGHNKALYYQDLVEASYIAQRQQLGIYKTDETPINLININTASTQMLMEHFDISQAQALYITNYRRHNPINSSQEIGFIDYSLGRSFIEANRDSIHYITDINSATIYELSSLFDSANSASKGSALNKERIFKPFDSVDELKYIDSVFGYYDLIAPYVTVDNNNNLYVEPDKERVNLNTANKTELKEIGGLSDYQADALYHLRATYGYMFYSVEELGKSNFPMQSFDMRFYSDELSTVTDVNEAGLVEIKSLYSFLNVSDAYKESKAQSIIKYRPYYSYSSLEKVMGWTIYRELKPYLVIGGLEKNEQVPININTAKDSEIIDYLNLDSDEAKLVTNRSFPYVSLENVDFINDSNRHLISLYTNINQASLEELRRMNSQVTYSIAKKMIEYRDYYPFYSSDELKEFFNNIASGHVYDLIKDYVVFY